MSSSPAGRARISAVFLPPLPGRLHNLARIPVVLAALHHRLISDVPPGLFLQKLSLHRCDRLFPLQVRSVAPEIFQTVELAFVAVEHVDHHLQVI